MRAMDRFPTTTWTLFESAHQSEEAMQLALAVLAERYWMPLYCLARRRGLAGPSAEDAVQGFVASLVERQAIGGLSRQRGRLRSFLRQAFGNYVTDQHRRATSLKRGKEWIHVSADVPAVEARLTALPGEPEAAFDREWALGILRRAEQALEREMSGPRWHAPFSLVAGYFRGVDGVSYQTLAEQHGMTISQVKSILHRARRRYRALVEMEVRDTMAPDASIEEELGWLKECLR